MFPPSLPWPVCWGAHRGVKGANFYQPSWWEESREEILQGRVRKMCNIYNRVVFSYNSVVICVLIHIYVVFHEMKSNSGKTKSRFLVDVWLPPKFLFLCVCLCVCVTLLSYGRKHFQKQRAWIEGNCLLHSLLICKIHLFASVITESLKILHAVLGASMLSHIRWVYI